MELEPPFFDFDAFVFGILTEFGDIFADDDVRPCLVCREQALTDWQCGVGGEEEVGGGMQCCVGVFAS